jgi:putative ABC transport system substrate-binding protein
VLFVENEGAGGFRLFAEFERKLRARLGDSIVPRVEFVPIGASDPESMRARYREALARKPAAVVAMSGGGAAIPISRIAPTMPMIFFTNADPILTGLVTDLNRPGGNRTGITTALETIDKRIEILKEAVPQARRVGVLVDPGDSIADVGADLARLESIGVTLVLREAATTPEDIRRVIAANAGIDAWYVPYNGASFFHGQVVVDALTRARRPAIFDRAKFADAGALLAYQHTVEDSVGRMAEMMASVLQGVSAGEIPVVRPQRFELVVNLAAARRLGITLPKGLVKRADRIVDE